MAPGLGFEPRYTAPEAVVLPLDDPGMIYLKRDKRIQNTPHGQGIVPFVEVIFVIN